MDEWARWFLLKHHFFFDQDQSNFVRETFWPALRVCHGKSFLIAQAFLVFPPSHPVALLQVLGTGSHQKVQNSVWLLIIVRPPFDSSLRSPSTATRLQLSRFMRFSSRVMLFGKHSSQHILVMPFTCADGFPGSCHLDLAAIIHKIKCFEHVQLVIIQSYDNKTKFVPYFLLLVVQPSSRPGARDLETLGLQEHSKRFLRIACIFITHERKGFPDPREPSEGMTNAPY